MAKPKKGLPASKVRQQPSAKPNPFELKTSKKKFDIVGKRDKGSTKNVVKARQEAVNKRKQTLLVEYKQLRKANTFIDRRFGEDDARLTEEDKSIARMQKQRIKDAKRTGAGKFALNDDDGEQITLTHLGKSLTEVDDFSKRPDLDDLDEDIIAEMVDKYNFGGGDLGPGGKDSLQHPDGRPKTKKEIMEDIIAKSKMYKAMKAKQKEEDEQYQEQLDQQFKSLVEGQSLARLLKAPGENKLTKQKADNAEDAKYDVFTRELVFESKAKAGERTLTAEELAEKERQRLEKLEKERLKRMRAGGGDDDDGSDDDGTDGGGFAARRKRQKMESGDALDENFDLSGSDSDGSEDDDAEPGGLSALDRRRQQRAAGDHPLQEAFREQALALLEKHGLAAPGSKQRSKQPAGSDGSGDEGSDEIEDGSDEYEGGSSDEFEGGSSEGEEEQEQAAAEEQEGSSSEEEEQQEEHPTKKQRQQPAFPAAAAAAAGGGGKQLEGPLDLPFTIPVPESYEQFAQLVAGRPAEELRLAVQRIQAFNASALATEHKRKLQVFYGILVQHFASLAGQKPLPREHLDVLLQLLLPLTAQVPFYSALVARTRLAKMQERLVAALQDLEDPANNQGWPTARVILQLKLFMTVFPTSDRRHPVLTPVALLLGRCLSQCPVMSPHQAATGLCLASLALHMAAPAKRYCPEVISYCQRLLQAALPPQQQHKQQQAADIAAVLVKPGLLHTAAQQQQDEQEEEVQPLGLYEVLGSETSSPSFSTASFKLGVLSAAVALLSRAAELYAQLDAFPEAFASCCTAAKQLLAASSSSLPAAITQQLQRLHSQLTAASSAAVARRLPLLQSKALAVPPVKEFNPRFEEEGYVKGKDYDPDRQRAEERKLKKQVAKERRGAIRELRKDAAFMSEQRDRERAQVDRERMASQKSFYAELQRQEADMKSGGQGGMNPHLKKKGKK